tara:strand:+ start:1853 stop:2866 length:1014 start_codon:yes stop_codon:yes gene_type:complete
MIRCKAPLRISFAGGGTDVSPFVEEHGGTVLNAAINLYSYCTLKPVEEDEIRIIDHDIGIEYVSKNGNPFKYDGVNDIAKAIINELLPLPGFELRLHTDARRGTGLGSSSTHAVTVLEAIYTWAGTELTSYDLAEKAYKIERIDLDQKGGRQDQYSAVFGGINFIEFEKSGTLVNPLNIKDEVLKELDYRMVFCSLNNTRSSPEIISDQVKRYVGRKSDTVDALFNTKQIAFDMKRALLTGDIDEMGVLINKSWQLKKDFSDHITNPTIDEVYDYALANGAIGGKVLGAGGGGHMIFIAESDSKWELESALYSRNIVSLPIQLGVEGVRVWSSQTGW